MQPELPQLNLIEVEVGADKGVEASRGFLMEAVRFMLVFPAGAGAGAGDDERSLDEVLRSFKSLREEGW